MADFRAEMRRRGVIDRRHPKTRGARRRSIRQQAAKRSSSTEESLRVFLRRTIGAARRRIAYLDGMLMLQFELLPCPRAAWFDLDQPCASSCICCGFGKVLVADTIKRYRQVLVALGAKP